MKRCIIAAIVTLLAPAGVLSEIRVSGLIDKDTRWNAEEGPFIVTNDILVSKNATLTITPGTQIFIIRPTKTDGKITQIDKFDSESVSIRIQGSLECLGKTDRRIIFAPAKPEPDEYSWYGIVFDGSIDQLTEVAYTDIAGAYNGVMVRNCKPIIRNTLFEHNYVGVSCNRSGSARIFNCVIAKNFASGANINGSNPYFTNSIIAFNRNSGIICDGISKIRFEYNCIYGNGDGDFLDCDPELGFLSKINKNKDSTDLFWNIYKNPIFAGSVSDSLATEHDISLPTDKSKIRDTTLAKVIHGSLKDSTAAILRHSFHRKYSLSRYSPCINGGNPSDQFKGIDGSKNDIGLYGGPEYIAEKKN